MASGNPGKGLWGWLGRQIGHVRKAVHAPVAQDRIVHRSQEVQEAVMPEQPNVKLRRTVIDEVIVEKKKGEK
jgi:hypothetical protein